MLSIFLRFLILFSIPVSIYGQNYRGAELRTLDSFLYGRFEVRYKPANGDGLVSSFFIYNDLNPITPWNEIDIEILGRYDNILDLVTITKGQDIHKSNQLVNFDPHLDFNVYAFEWIPDYVAWFVNGEEVYRQSHDHVALLVEPQKIMMNIWNPVYSDWVGVWDDRILPRFSYYDYVSYASYTPDSGNVGTDNNFTSEWQDNFSFFDSTRWEKKDNHTWPGNQALFIKENTIFEDGYMILCLTDDVNISYVDYNLPQALWARSDRDNKITVRFSEELDLASAENPNNYVISGVEIFSAQLLEDLRTVELSVSQLDFENLGNIVLMGVKDDAEPPNKLLGQVLNIITPDPLSFPIKINVGGNEFMGFLPDQWWSNDNEYGHEDGSYRLVNENISNTELDMIYASYVSRLVSYKVRLIDGIYQVKMMFCENYYEGPGKRVFDVYAEGDRVVQDLDIYALVGRYSAYDLMLEDITVTDGILDIYFSPVNFGNGPYEDRGALLNGLVIERIGGLGTEHGSIGQPQKYALHHNYPNPFNPNTTIEYTLPKQANIIITIYNLLGEHVATLINQKQDTGYHKCIWNAEDQPSGVYFYKLQTESFTQVKKMLLLR